MDSVSMTELAKGGIIAVILVPAVIALWVALRQSSSDAKTREEECTKRHDELNTYVRDTYAKNIVKSTEAIEKMTAIAERMERNSNNPK